MINKQKIILILATLGLAGTTLASTYYWDVNGATAGFGLDGNQATTLSGIQWSTSAAGTDATAAAIWGAGTDDIIIDWSAFSANGTKLMGIDSTVAINNLTLINDGNAGFMNLAGVSGGLTVNGTISASDTIQTSGSGNMNLTFNNARFISTAPNGQLTFNGIGANTVHGSLTTVGNTKINHNAVSALSDLNLTMEGNLLEMNTTGSAVLKSLNGYGEIDNIRGGTGGEISSNFNPDQAGAAGAIFGDFDALMTDTSTFDIFKTGALLTNDKMSLTDGGNADGDLNWNGSTVAISANGDALVEGDSFDLFDAVTFSGSIGSVDLTGASLTTGLSWDTSALETTGTITVIPEPATLGLVAAMGGSILFIRRRFMI